MLNPGLKKLLKRGNGSFLVVGSPGTGKTYQLIKLIEHLIIFEKIEPQRILAFCFNRRWAKILREATSELMCGSIFEIPITTFFAYCTDMIKRIQVINPSLKNGSCNNEIRVLNAPEQWLLLKNTITGDLERHKYPITFSHILNKNANVVSSYIQEVFDFILRAQENLLDPSDLSELFKKNSTPVMDEITGIYSSYKRTLIRENLYNYGRLLEDTVEFFKKNNRAKKIIRDSYDYIIVDDLQEVNKAQYEIIKALSRNNCIFFGNDDQCTYAFRGSMINIFNEVYKNLDTDQGKSNNVLFLEKNYRSGSSMNEINNLFIRKNAYRLSKTSKTNKSRGGSVIVKEFKNTIDEINFIVDRINDLILRKQMKPEDILILVKGRGYKTRLLENILESNNIAFFQRNSGALLDNPHVRYILNFIKLIILLKKYYKNRNGLKDYRTIPEDELNAVGLLYEAIIFSDFVGIKPTSLLGKNTDTKDIWKKLQAVPLLDKTVMDFLKLKKTNAFKVILIFLNDKRIGIFKHLSDKHTLGERKRSTIISLIGDFLHTVKDFVEKNPDANSISDYINYLEDAMASNFLEEIEDSTKEFMRPGFINIMSFHHCRGLEFDAVFIPFVNKNYLPAEFGNTQLYDMQTFNYFSEGKKVPDELLRKKHLEDERKLFYTGLTRAKKFLCISSNIQENMSIFFEEIKAIQKNLVEKEPVSERLLKTKKELKGCGGSSQCDLQENYIYSGKNWLLRKSMVSRTFKFASNGRLNKRKFNSDLMHLIMNYHYSGWWRTRKITENRNKPNEIHNPSYSYSSLSTFEECPLKYKLKYLFNIGEEKNLAIFVGSLYHEILKAFFNQPEKDYSWQNLKKAVINTFSSDKYGFEFNYLRNEVFQKALRDFRRFHEYFIKGKELNVMSEKEFSFMIDGDLIRGRIDQINLISDTEAQLIDFKSGSRNFSAADIQKDIQLRIYRMAIDLCSDLDFIKGRDISLKYVFIGDEKNKDPSVLLPDSIYDTDDFQRYLKSIIKKVKSEHFIADPEDYLSCKFCGYRLLCPNKNA